MRAQEFTVEAEHRAQTTEHLINRIKVAANLCDTMNDYPLLFRDFRSATPAYTVLGKITNSHRGRNIKAGQAGQAQAHLLEQLGIDNPVFTKMTKPTMNLGPFGESHIFIPPAGAPVRWSPRVKDIGSLALAEAVAWSPEQVTQLADTYKTSLPTEYTDHEIIFDCDQYYLINIQAFLKKFAGRANREFLEYSRYSNVRLKIDPAIFDTRITNYKELAWYLRNTAIDFLKEYEARAAQHRSEPVAENSAAKNKDVNEIARLPKSDAGDFGDKGTLENPTYSVKKKPLPGGTGFTYAVTRDDENLEIMIFDGDTLAAELDLFYTRDVTKAWRVETVVVDPDYRGRGLGKALYGIALSILKLTLEAGDTQTRNGQQMWLMLNSIPGVTVQGYNQQRTSEYTPQRGDNIIDQNTDWTRYTFPVKPGSASMRSGRRGTGIYTTQASMIAKWNGQ